jgi:hypothetical protein
MNSERIVNMAQNVTSSNTQTATQINALLGDAGRVEVRKGHAFGQRGRGKMSTSPSAWFFRFPADHVLANRVVAIDDPRRKTPEEIIAGAEEAHRRSEEMRSEVAARQNG